MPACQRLLHPPAAPGHPHQPDQRPAANAAARTKDTYLAAHYQRIKGRRGHHKAIIAVAHSILVIVWHLLTGNQPYADLGGDYFLERRRSQAYKNRLVRQLERMGHKVTLEPLGSA